MAWGGYRPDVGNLNSLEGTVCAILSVQIYRPETGLLRWWGFVFVGGHSVRDFKRVGFIAQKLASYVGEGSVFVQNQTISS